MFLGDIPRYQRSKVDSIFLVIAADHSVIDKDSQEKDKLMKEVSVQIPWLISRCCHLLP
jgi:hypothetical protein